MIFPDFSQFSTLAQQGNFVPVYQEWVADLDTPVSAWYKVCVGQPYSFLLESVEGGEKLGRYSFLGCDPLWVLEARGNITTQTHRKGEVKTFEGDPFAALAECLEPYKPVKVAALPPGIGGLFGFWGYELIRWIEPRVPIHAETSESLPDGVWMQVDNLMIFDQVKRKIWAIAYADLRGSGGNIEKAYHEARDRVTQLVSKLQLPLSGKDTFLEWTPPEKALAGEQGSRFVGAGLEDNLSNQQTTLQQNPPSSGEQGSRFVGAGLEDNLSNQQTTLQQNPPSSGEQEESLQSTYTSNTSREQFCANVEKAKDYIKAGDIFQVVLSQRLLSSYTGDPFSLYRSLRLINPSPYMAYFNFSDWQIIGSSPEVMVKAERTPEGEIKATLRPIAGTRRRGQTPTSDDALAQDLLQDPKEIAEHIMLVDLGRNDVGRVCRSGAVKVDELMVIERYSHVMHIVSNVVGELAPGKTAWDLLKACFPAGTVSGAPKIRAMEIIYELEQCRRGVYSGVYGYYDFEGQLNSAIAIRTMVVRPQENGKHTVEVQAGAGLVADSEPEKEYEESINKATALLEAIRCLHRMLS